VRPLKVASTNSAFFVKVDYFRFARENVGAAHTRRAADFIHKFSARPVEAAAEAASFILLATPRRGR
jgi:hypothetical protein